VAFHLGRICEQREHLAEALNYYLTAQALAEVPTDAMRGAAAHSSSATEDLHSRRGWN
jgi:hypothetical protein